MTLSPEARVAVTRGASVFEEMSTWGWEEGLVGEMAEGLCGRSTMLCVRYVIVSNFGGLVL